jgi:hypothetical protein
MKRLKSFLAAAPGAAYGSLNREEVRRILAAALAAGFPTAAIVATIFTNPRSYADPETAGLYAALATLAVEAFRRYRQQHQPGPTP